MSLERPQGRMFYLAESFLTLGKIYNFNQIKAKIKAINPREIKDLACDIFKFNNMCVSCVGNIEDKAQDSIMKIAKKGVSHP